MLSAGIIKLSEALDYQNRTFQLAHILCFVESENILNDITSDSNFESQRAVARCHVELANYFAAALLMPYDAFHAMAEQSKYDIDRMASAFAVSFEQVCQRLTTLQRETKRGVPFFFLRVDKAGNVTKRFNATSFNIAEHGGSCPVWNLHTAFPDARGYSTAICRTNRWGEIFHPGTNHRAPSFLNANPR